MTEDKAREAARLLSEIRAAENVVCRLKEKRSAKETGLDPTASGPRNYVLDTIANEWGRLGEKCIAFFISAMDEAIANEEKRIVELMKELEDL